VTSGFFASSCPFPAWTRRPQLACASDQDGGISNRFPCCRRRIPFVAAGGREIWELAVISRARVWPGRQNIRSSGGRCTPLRSRHCGGEAAVALHADSDDSAKRSRSLSERGIAVARRATSSAENCVWLGARAAGGRPLQSSSEICGREEITFHLGFRIRSVFRV